MIPGVVVCVGAGPLTGVCLDLSIEITSSLMPYLLVVTPCSTIFDQVSP